MSNLRFVSYMTPGFSESLFELMADAMGADLHLVQDRSGPDPTDDPFAAGRFDLGWVCSTSYVSLGLASPRPSIQLAGVAWIPDDLANNGLPRYFGDVVVPADQGRAVGAQSLADLAGLRIGCNDQVSLSGHHALRWAATDEGLNPDTFADLVFTGGHQRSLDLLLAGELDAAVIDSVIRLRRARHDESVAGLRVLERLGPWPTQPLVARADLHRSELTEIRANLLAAARQPEFQSALQAAALRDLIEVGADHYHSVRERMTTRG